MRGWWRVGLRVRVRARARVRARVGARLALELVLKRYCVRNSLILRDCSGNLG